MEPNPPPIPPQETAMIKDILSQIMSLPLTWKQKEIAESFVSGAVYSFPGNPRPAFLLAKMRVCGLTPEELKEFEQYDFFPEEHPRETPFIRERREIEIRIDEERTHNVEIVNKAPKIDLDDEHIRVIEETLQKIAGLAPQIVEKLRKIFVIEELGSEEAEYAPNGYVTKRQCDKHDTGIVLKQRGYRTDISHRIAGVSNLEGTITHEFGHIICSLFPDFVKKWRETLGYHRIEDLDGKILDGWKKHHDKKREIIEYYNAETEMKSRTGLVPADLSKLPSCYACFNIQEDISDSFVAWVFGKPLDEKRKGLFKELFENILIFKKIK